MDSLPDSAVSFASRLRAEEWLLATLGVFTALALLGTCGLCVISGAAVGAGMAYAVGIAMFPPLGRGRLLLNYVAVWTFYAGSTRVTEALGFPLWHAQLLAWDRVLFGETPSIIVQGRFPGWVNDLCSLGYLSYHVYLHWVLIDALWRSDAWRAAYSRAILCGFGIGFWGYLLTPASGPSVAFPELFTHPLMGGGATWLNEAVVGNLGSKYDAFPSLHILVTGLLLATDWHWHRTRWKIMVAPSLVLVASTLVLRLHFAVDLLAGAALFACLRPWIHSQEVTRDA